MSCKIFIKVFDAKNILNLNNVASNPFTKFWFKGKQESSIKTKTIYNTLNPSWNENLEILSDDYNSDILQICMYTEDKENSYPIMDICEYPLRYRLFGEHLVFNEEIKKQNFNAGILHFELDFLLYPESPLKGEISAERQAAKKDDTNNQDQSDLKTDILILKQENQELKQQFKEVVNLQERQTSKIQEDLQKLKNENEELIKKLSEKSDSPITTNSNISINYFIDENESKFYENDEKLSEDANSIVYKTTDNRTSKIVCKKVLKIDKSKATLQDFEDSLNDFEFLCSLHHPCICDAIGVNKSEPVKTADENDKPSSTTVALFFEFCPYSLKDLLANKMMDNTLKTKVVVEIAHAILFVHNKGLIYGSLSIDNVMLNSIFEVKIINLGFSQICERLSKSSYTVSQSSENFLSPEMLGEKEYSYKTDVYSFGAILYYIFSEKPLDFPLNDKQNKFSMHEQSTSMSDFCIELVSKCLSVDPDERPSFKEVLEEIKSHSYSLASNVDESIISKRDDELINYD